MAKPESESNSKTTPKTPSLLQSNSSVEQSDKEEGTNQKLAPKKKVSLGPQLFFDADYSTFDKEGLTHRFEGNVIAIAARIIISADRLVFDKKNNQVFGEGHVVVIAPSQVISGTSLVLETSHNEFTMTDAMILVNDSQALQKYNREILGFTSQELTFEAERNNRLSEISEKKASIRDLFRNEAKTKPDASLIEPYVALLEQSLYC